MRLKDVSLSPKVSIFQTTYDVPVKLVKLRNNFFASPLALISDRILLPA